MATTMDVNGKHEATDKNTKTRIPTPTTPEAEATRTTTDKIRQNY
jgi:hypothetical protein